MGKTQDIDLNAPFPVSALKLDPPPSEAARETWKKMVDSGPVPVVANTASVPATNEIPFSDFEKVDIRVGEIKAVESVPKSNKLLKLEVDFGPLGTRTILAGIAKFYPAPQTLLVGNRFAFVVNLAPRPMMGLMSHGMALAADGGALGGSLLSCGTALPGARVG